MSATTRPRAGLVERVLNAALRLDPEWPEALAPLEGRTLEVVVEPGESRLAVCVTREGVRVVGTDGPGADVTVRGPLPALLAAVRGDALPSGLHVSGDLGVLQLARRQLGRLDIDWEEFLARRIGDVPGRQAGRAIRAGADFGVQAGTTIVRDVVEYLAEEAGLLTTAWPVERFCTDVDALRDDVDRLVARVDRVAASRPDTRAANERDDAPEAARPARRGGERR